MSEKPEEIVRGWQGLYPYLPYKATTLRQMVLDGRLAPPIKLGQRAIGWRKSDIVKCQQRIFAKQSKSPKGGE